MRILKWTGMALSALVIVTGVLYLLRTDPIYMISGKRLSGDELPYPADWSMCNDHQTIAARSPRGRSPLGHHRLLRPRGQPHRPGDERQRKRVARHGGPRPPHSGEDRRGGLCGPCGPLDGCVDVGPATVDRREVPADCRARPGGCTPGRLAVPNYRPLICQPTKVFSLLQRL